VGNKLEVDMVVKAVAQGFEKVSSDVASIGKSGDAAKGGVSNFSNSMTELNSAVNLAMTAFGAFSGAAKQVYDLGKEGTQLEFTAGKFDRLSKSINTTGDTLMTKLRAATQGLISDTELMASASDFMTLGLAKTEDEVIRLTNVAGQLGMNMNQLVLTLTNQTTMRFDSLGVAVDGFDERLKGLKDAGMDTNAAFTEAFLQQAEDQIGKVGSIADSSTASFMRLEAATQDISAEFKRSLVPAVVAVIEPLGVLITANRKLTDIINANDDAVTEASATYEDYLAEKERELKLAGLTMKVTEDGIKVYRVGGRGLVDLTDKYKLLTKSGFDMEKSNKVVTASFEDMGQAAAYVEPPIEAVAKAMEEGRKKIDDALTANHERALDFAISGDWGKSWDEYRQNLDEVKKKHADLITDLETIKNQGYSDTSEKVRGLNEALAENEGKQTSLTEKMKLTSKEMLYQQLAAGLNADQAFDLAYKMGLVDEESYNAALRIEELKKQYVDSGAPMDEYITRAVDLADAIQRIQNKSVTVRVNFVGGGAGNVTMPMPVNETTIRRELDPTSYPDVSGGFAGKGYASGADFTVPAGFPNDSYPMRVQSGEHVQVTPAGQQSGDAAVLQQILAAVSRGNRSPSARDIGSEVARALVTAGVVS
jgi:hypothetical protein